MYESKGFTDDQKLVDLLSPYIPVYPWTTKMDKPNKNFWSFDKLPTDKLLQLCELLPEEIVDNRQNSAPSFQSIVDIVAKRYPASLFLGYVVGSERSDERVTLEGFYVALEDGDFYSLVDEGLDTGTRPDEYSKEEVNGLTYRRFWWD